MIRVLHVLRSLNAGGIGAFIMNVYRKIDRNKIQFDFALTHGGNGVFGDEIERLGGKIYFLTKDGNRGLGDGITQVMELYKLCKKTKYDIIHCHYYFANAWFLMAAKKAGIKVRVSHCHNAGEIRTISISRKIFEFISQKLLLSQGTEFLACSTEAAIFLYGKKNTERGKAKVLYNGIDYGVFDKEQYDTTMIRKELGLGGSDKVCVFVGRFEEQKNPLFALEVFKKITEIRNDTKLIMIGYGSLEQSVKEYINSNSLDDAVIMLPPNSDIAKVQAASDIMIAPSKWEGLSIAYIEAQKMLTVVVASAQISSEVDMGYCEYVELESVDKWVEIIINLLDAPNERIYNNERYEKFNINYTVRKLMDYYKVEQ